MVKLFCFIFQETEQLKIRQEITLEAKGLKHDLDLLKQGHEATVSRLEVIERENEVLRSSLTQRDEEIARQQDVVQ